MLRFAPDEIHVGWMERLSIVQTRQGLGLCVPEDNRIINGLINIFTALEEHVSGLTSQVFWKGGG